MVALGIGIGIPFGTQGDVALVIEPLSDTFTTVPSTGTTPLGDGTGGTHAPDTGVGYLAGSSGLIDNARNAYVPGLSAGTTLAYGLADQWADQAEMTGNLEHGLSDGIKAQNLGFFFVDTSSGAKVMAAVVATGAPVGAAYVIVAEQPDDVSPTSVLGITQVTIAGAKQFKFSYKQGAVRFDLGGTVVTGTTTLGPLVIGVIGFSGEDDSTTEAALLDYATSPIATGFIS